MTGRVDLLQLESLFDQACELSPEELEHWLRELGHTRPETAARMRGLLDLDRAGRSQTLPKVGTRWERTRLQPGARVGSFTIVRWIGAGGMGDVYLGERPAGDGMQRSAIKMLPADLGDAKTRSRIALEQRVLATLEHTGIARLLESGTREDGTPYFAMDYVDGVSIERYADAQRLGIRARIELLLRVCEIVRTAHASLIVHRDIKASNVLVRADGQPVLLDFGIAKPLTDTQEPSNDTQEHTRFLSPHNAPPEQWGAGEPTVGVDIYALGTLIHELLTGVPVFDFADIPRAAIENHVRTAPPLPLDQRWARLPLELRREVAANRGTSPTTLQRALADRDIDAIVQKCLRKLPAERYRSIDALIDDLSDWLACRPVKARRGLWWYRLGKYVRRNAWPAAITTGMVVAAITAGVFIWKQEHARLGEQTRADAVENLLLNAIASADPTETLGIKVTAGDILARARRDISARPDLPAQSKANFLLAVAKTYQELGEHKTVLAVCDEATLAIADAGSTEISLQAALIRSAAHNALDNLQAAESTLIDSRSLPLNHAQRWRLDIAYLDFLFARGRYGEVEKSLANMEKYLPQIPGEDRTRSWQLRYWRAAVQSAQHDDFTGAARELESLYRDQRAAGDNYLPEALRTLSRLTSERLRSNTLSDLRTGVDEAISLTERIYGRDSKRYYDAVANRGSAMGLLGDPAAGLKDLRLALDYYAKNMGESHRVTTTITFDAAQTAETLDPESSETLELTRKFVERANKAYPANHPNRFMFMAVGGFYLVRHGHEAEAIDCFRTVLAIGEADPSFKEWTLYDASHIGLLAAPLLASGKPLTAPSSEIAQRYAAVVAANARGEMDADTLRVLTDLQRLLIARGMAFDASNTLVATTAAPSAGAG